MQVTNSWMDRKQLQKSQRIAFGGTDRNYLPVCWSNSRKIPI